MFGNLIESGSHKGDNKRKGSFFVGTLAVYALAFLAIGVGSIYAYNTHVENQDLRLVSLVTPTESAEVQRPQRRDTPRPATANNNRPDIAVVRTPPLITRMDPQLVPNKVSVSSPVPQLPEGTIYKIGIPTSGDNMFGISGDKSGDGSRGGNSTGDSNGMDKLVRDTPPPPMKIEPSKPPTPKIVRSPGPVNGKATYLPKPAYTAIAKAGRASGVVIVEVLIDENGKVVSAHAVSGHPLLLKEAVQAAWQARFSPTTLGDQRVKVSGVITYNFVLQ
jgi:TonB family protein